MNVYLCPKHHTKEGTLNKTYTPTKRQGCLQQSITPVTFMQGIEQESLHNVMVSTFFSNKDNSLRRTLKKEKRKSLRSLLTQETVFTTVLLKKTLIHDYVKINKETST